MTWAERHLDLAIEPEPPRRQPRRRPARRPFGPLLVRECRIEDAVLLVDECLMP
ncbi:hypothetical protein ABZ622_37710 [Streptomyces sp. NPDC007164]|uniref:hypothetical protein n=1 Tax=Streptomyces sp. NPDC007164 TaxID=3156918 RepID=UPI00340EE9FA